jgi:hypothetical protein
VYVLYVYAMYLSLLMKVQHYISRAVTDGMVLTHPYENCLGPDCVDILTPLILYAYKRSGATIPNALV